MSVKSSQEGLFIRISELLFKNKLRVYAVVIENPKQGEKLKARVLLKRWSWPCQKKECIYMFKMTLEESELYVINKMKR